ncbi:MAG: hypothetical protein LBM65_04130 [Oscillospiraceae bacterium]|jgi:stage III sporulation protein AG|nr:hypothetical protein [Oscillospiraceae bacterium]
MEKQKTNLSLKNILQNKKVVQIAAIAGMIGIVIIFISSIGLPGSGGQEDEEKAKAAVASADYGQQIEADLVEVAQSIEGVGRAKVFVTMEDSSETVYLENKDIQTKEIAPKVRGVVVVCDGASNPIVSARVIDAVTKGLNISSNKVCVTKLAA